MPKHDLPDDLPNELKEPIREDDLLRLAREIRKGGGKARGLAFVAKALKISHLLRYFRRAWPSNEDEWLEFMVEVGTVFIPGFEVTSSSPGAPPKWPAWRELELIFDVKLLMAKNQKLKEYAACKRIVDKREEYGTRYPEELNTLYRRYLSAKKRHANFSPELDPAEVRTESQQREFREVEERMRANLVELEAWEKRRKK